MTSIFVAKLDFGVTEEELKELFEQYGGVRKVHIAKDKETGKPRGFAFVEMFNDDEGQAAIEALDGMSINGRNIAVKEAEDRGGSKPANRDSRPAKPRVENNGSYERPAKQDDAPPYIPPIEDLDELKPLKSEPKRKKSGPKTRTADEPVDGKAKKPKMNAYKKSGKNNHFFDDEDELDEDFDLFGRDEDEELDEDYSKYLVNSDDDEDDFYDDADEDDTDW